MPLFAKRIVDEEWLQKITPLYTSASDITNSFRSALAQDEISEQQIEITSRVLQTFPDWIQNLDLEKEPESREAREARKNLLKALRQYLSAAKLAASLYQDLAKGLADRAQYSGLARGRISMLQSRIASNVVSAWQPMERAEVYFEKNIPKTGPTLTDEMTLNVPTLENSTSLRLLKSLDSSIVSISFSSDGKRIYSGDGQGTVFAWEAENGKELFRWELPESLYSDYTDERPDQFINAQVFSPDKSWVAFADCFGRLFITDLSSGARSEICNINNYQDAYEPRVITSIAISPERLELFCGDNEGSIWRFQVNSLKQPKYTSRKTAVYVRNEGEVTSLAVTKDGNRIFAADVKHAHKRLIDIEGAFNLLEQGRASEAMNVVSEHVTARALLWSRSKGKRTDVSIVAGGPARFYDEDVLDTFWSGYYNPEDRDRDMLITTVAISPDGNITAVCGFKDPASLLRVNEITSGHATKALYDLEGHGGLVNCLSFSFDGHLLISSALDNTARVWEMESGHQLCQIDYHDQISADITCVEFSPDATGVILGDTDGSIWSWQLPS